MENNKKQEQHQHLMYSYWSWETGVIIVGAFVTQVLKVSLEEVAVFLDLLAFFLIHSWVGLRQQGIELVFRSSGSYENGSFP